jgi:hypothetical protein
LSRDIASTKKSVGKMIVLDSASVTPKPRVHSVAAFFTFFAPRRPDEQRTRSEYLSQAFFLFAKYINNNPGVLEGNSSEFDKQRDAHVTPSRGRERYAVTRAGCDAVTLPS